MPYKYEFGVRLPLRCLMPAAKDVEDSLNEAMHGFGFPDKVIITRIVPIMLTCDWRPTDEQLRQIKQIILDGFAERCIPVSIEYTKLLSV